MIDDEGSWEIPNIMDVNPDLADHVVQGRVPITDDASKNKLQTASICAAVYKDSPQLDEAKKMSWATYQGFQLSRYLKTWPAWGRMCLH